MLRRPTSALAGRLSLLAAVVASACWPPDPGTLPGPDASSREAQPEADIRPNCDDTVERMVVAKVAAAAPCFNGHVTTDCGGRALVCAYFDLDLGNTDCHHFQFHRIDNQSLGRIREAADLALQGVDVSHCHLSTTILDPALDRLRKNIIDCGGFGHVITFDSTGAIVDVRQGSTDLPDLFVRDCVQAADGGASFPCLADTQICTSVILANQR